MIKISVIIPSYNSIRYYQECIESIMEQGGEEIEIIPVDAESVDGTWELISSYAESDPRIHPIRSERKSYGYQCNLGICAANGEYVAVAESDDCLAPHMYKQLYQAASENRLDWVKADFDFFVDLGERLFLHYPILPSAKKKVYGKVLDLTCDPQFIFRDLNLWNGIYKREFLKKEGIQFQETRGAAFQDISFVLQTFMAAKRFMYLPGHSYRYRQDNQMSSIYNPARIRYVRDEFQYMMDFLERNVKRYGPYRAVLIKKLFGDFKGAYERIPRLEELEEKDRECLHSFRQCVQLQYDRLSDCERLEEQLMLNLHMDLFIHDLNYFDFLVRREREMVRRTQKTVIQMAEANQVVIAGVGEWGSGLYAFLKNNRVNTVEAFCDNNPSAAGKEHMGMKVLRMEEACRDLRESLFLVSSSLYYQEIKKQLLSLGIKPEQIVKSPMIPLHEALEDRVQERGF